MPQVREAAPGDAAGIRAIHEASFEGDGETRLVDRLVADGLSVASVIAEVDETIVGHVLFSALPIRTDLGDDIRAASLAPLDVLPSHRRRGAGAALVHYGLALCRGRGIAAVVVLGDPAYYHRFDFSSTLARRVSAPWSGDALTRISHRRIVWSLIIYCKQTVIEIFGKRQKYRVFFRSGPFFVRRREGLHGFGESLQGAPRRRPVFPVLQHIDDRLVG